jgi:hypothetical protein
MCVIAAAQFSELGLVGQLQLTRAGALRQFRSQELKRLTICPQGLYYRGTHNYSKAII